MSAYTPEEEEFIRRMTELGILRTLTPFERAVVKDIQESEDQEFLKILEQMADKEK